MISHVTLYYPIMTVAKTKRYVLFVALFILVFVSLAVVIHYRNTSTSKTSNAIPTIILWAWERPENFSFIDTKETGVAFLAQTIEIKNDDAMWIPRRQPLEIPKGIYVIAVTRIESDKKEKPILSDKQKNKITEIITRSSSLPNVRAVQIDFDATPSEREFYKNLLLELRRQLPNQISLTITALASWCMYDNWIKDAPIDDAVPMLFRMGVDERNIVSYLNTNKNWREPLCNQSYGISLDEPVRKVDISRRLYVFNPRSWSKDDFQKIYERVTR